MSLCHKHIEESGYALLNEEGTATLCHMCELERRLADKEVESERLREENGKLRCETYTVEYVDKQLEEKSKHSAWLAGLLGTAHAERDNAENRLQEAEDVLRSIMSERHDNAHVSMNINSMSLIDAHKLGHKEAGDIARTYFANKRKVK